MHACAVAGLGAGAAGAARAIGQVEGNDVSVESGMRRPPRTSTAAPSIYVSNGSVVTVHSGQARMTLFAGGEVDICGPAKITVLKSGDAITLALNFGRVRVRTAREDVSARFHAHDHRHADRYQRRRARRHGGAEPRRFALRAGDAAARIQLEHQFTGEKLIVPQAGEFFLECGQAGCPWPARREAASAWPRKLSRLLRRLRPYRTMRTLLPRRR